MTKRTSRSAEKKDKKKTKCSYFYKLDNKKVK